MEAELGRHVVRVQREGRAGERAGAQWRHVEAVDRDEEAVDVAGQGPTVGQEVVRQEYGLGPLHVRVPREVGVGRLAGALGQGVLQSHDLGRHGGQVAAAPEAQVGGHLVVAAAPGVQLGPGVAGQLGHPALDGGVHVLVTGGEDEGAVGQLLLNLVQCIEEFAHLAVGQDARLGQTLDVGPGSCDVVGRQDLVERKAEGVGRHRLGHVSRDAALPERHGSGVGSASVSAWSVSAPGPWRADQVATPRPQRRTNPSASWWRKVSAAS